ncbi:SGNH/GDSL hydrolase family protein [Streptomyces sp. P9(2023)]|uniref:SGNH/GDSL hydrolase family protein n=1 Tax=Streptomyces sp. P9(2023) TaxID=3064394 RepID=UPI0028F41AD9|nr:SGNH/GDSL hydrolase family protein [Streptomyces sp. P9(2023)]MDT9692120.1 SGNH/GDSL hydrolase family protein [Streptomyces sp. P9(2023)]
MTTKTTRTASTTTVRRTTVALATAAVLTALQLGGAVASEQRHESGPWRGAWATSPQSPTAPFGPNWSEQGFSNHTVRQVVRVTTSGTKARIELSNRYGTTPLRITGATVARTDKGASVKAGSVRQLSFGKGRSVTIPAGGTTYSDGVPFAVKALESVTVTLYLAAPTGPATFHTFSSATSYRAAGDHRSDRDGTAFTETSDSWYYLSGVEVSGGAAARRDGIVTFGDSITDGVGSGLNANNRYPDELAERLAAAGKPRSVLNHGIGGNQVVNDTTWAGEKGIERFKKDVLTEPGVRTVIVLEGINDIGGSGPAFPGGPTAEVSAERLIEGHRELIRQAHAKGIKVVGATLTPIKGSFYESETNEAKRLAVNEWIRTSGEYDEVVDFDRALDPKGEGVMLPAYDSGDHLHPSDAGYRAMAEALDLDEL